jgi:hypothetical protein
MSSRITRLAVFGFIVLIVACNGESPTSPTPFPIPTAAARLRPIISTTSSHTIRVAKLTFDGAVVQTVELPGGGGEVSFDTTVQATAGEHVVGLVIVDQASTPNRYFVSGSITLPAKILDFARIERDLATGQALELKVVF